MWITDGDKYVNLSLCRTFGIGETSDGDVCLFANEKPELVLEMGLEEATFRFYELLKTEGGGPYSQKVVHLADYGMIQAQFFAAMNMHKEMTKRIED